MVDWNRWLLLGWSSYAWNLQAHLHLVTIRMGSMVNRWRRFFIFIPSGRKNIHEMKVELEHLLSGMKIWLFIQPFITLDLSAALLNDANGKTKRCFGIILNRNHLAWSWLWVDVALAGTRIGTSPCLIPSVLKFTHSGSTPCQSYQFWKTSGRPGVIIRSLDLP